MKLLAAALGLALAAPAAAQTVSPAVQAALAAPARSDAEKARDATRKPAELLTFAGVKPGDKVADFIMGGGYWTPILSALVGRNGKVYAYQPAEFISFRAAYGTEQDAAVKDRANVVASRQALTGVTFPEPLDVIMTVQNWHDFHLKIAPPGSAERMAAHIFSLLKPGGVFLVVDHAAVSGAPLTVADTLHRIDPAKARAEIEKAGFVLEAQSPIYARPDDPKTQIVFDPAIRGKTDQFVYKLRKPQ
jgi:predicted methyltransferase